MWQILLALALLFGITVAEIINSHAEQFGNPYHNSYYNGGNSVAGTGLMRRRP